jgi:hypothetical protein
MRRRRAMANKFVGGLERSTSLRRKSAQFSAREDKGILVAKVSDRHREK